MAKKKEIVTEDLLSVNDICLELKLNNSTKQYLLHKYEESTFSKNDWEILLNKDGLTF